MIHTGYQVVDCTGIKVTDSGQATQVKNQRLADALRSTKPIFIDRITLSKSGVETSRSGWATLMDTNFANGKTVRLTLHDAVLTFSTLDDTVTINYAAV